MGPLVFAVALLVAAAPAKTLRMGAVGNLDGGLQRDLRTSGAPSAIAGMILRGMTYYDADVRMRCALCEAFPTVANGGVVDEADPEGKPGQAVTFRLKDARWDNGDPVTAQDFVLAWTVGRAENSGYAWRTRLRDEIWSVTALDARTLVVHRRGRSCEPGDFRISPLPSRLTTVDKGVSPYVQGPATSGLYNGPYRVAEAAKDRVVLARNDHWKGERPAYDRVELAVKPDQAGIVQGLIDGEFDFLPNAALATANEIARRAPGRSIQVRRAGRALMQVTMNLDDPLVADVRVRQALLAALDRENLAGLFDAKAEAATSFLTRRFPYFDPSVPDVDNRRDEAARLLDAAGWRLGADGFRHDPSGRPLRPRLAVQRSHAEAPFVAALLESWRRLGVEAVREPWTGIGQHTGEAPPTLALFGYLLEGASNIDHHVLASRSVPKAGETSSGLNIFRYRNAEVDAATDQLDGGCPADVAPLYATLQRRVNEDLPFLPLFFAPEAHLLPPDMLPPRRTVIFMPSDEIETWRVRDARVS